MADRTAYLEKLKHPLWQKKRLLVFERDQFTCTQCGNTETELHLHHKFYIDGIEPWEYPNDVLLTLCRDCHDKELVRWKYESYLLHTLRAAGFNAFEILALSVFTEKYNGFKEDLKRLIKNSVDLGL